MIHLHIGLHKTGTTTLQAYLAHNRERLAALGVLYPQTSRSGTAHHGLTLPLLKRRRHVDAGVLEDAAQTWERVLAQIDAHSGDTILSSESFSIMDASEVDRLAELIGQRPLRVIVYLRHPAELAASAWGYQLKSGQSAKPWRDFLQMRSEGGGFMERLQRWERFGRDNVVVRVLERAQLHGGDLVADFSQAVGLPAPGPQSGLEQVPDQNSSPGWKTLALLAQARLTGDASRDLREAVMDAAEAAGWNAEKPQLLTEADYVAFEETFGEDMAATARRYLGRADGRLLISPRKLRPLTPPSIEAVPQAELVGVLLAAAGVAGVAPDALQAVAAAEPVAAAEGRAAPRREKREREREERRRAARAERGKPAPG